MCVCVISDVLCEGATFVEGPACEQVSAVGKSRAARAEGLVLAAAGFGTRLAARPPGRPHRAAAGVQSEAPWDRLTARILVPRQVAAF